MMTLLIAPFGDYPLQALDCHPLSLVSTHLIGYRLITLDVPCSSVETPVDKIISVKSLLVRIWMWWRPSTGLEPAPMYGNL